MSLRRSTVLLALGMVSVWLAAGCGGKTSSPADGGTPDAGTPDAGPMCIAPQQECDGGCVDTTTSVDHCGSCGMACGSGYACAGGLCHPDCQGIFDGSLVAFTFSAPSPRIGAVGTQFVITVNYTIQQPVAAAELTFVVTDINGAVLSTQTMAATNLSVGNHTATGNFDSTGLAPGFYTATFTVCAPGGGDQISATFRAT